MRRFNEKRVSADMDPSRFQLAQNYPNPFSERTTIKYCVPRRERIVLTIYDADDEMVQRLVDKVEEPGTYEVVWHAKKMSHGVYKYEMKAAEYRSTKEMELKK